MSNVNVIAKNAVRMRLTSATRHLRPFGHARGLSRVQPGASLPHFGRQQPSALNIQQGVSGQAIGPRAVTFVHASVRWNSHEQTAKDLNQQGVDDALSDYDTAIGEEKEKQTRAPWHRQGADTPPVRRQRSAGAMTKGKCYL